MYWVIERKGCENLRGNRVQIDRISMDIEDGILPNGNRGLYRAYYAKDAHGNGDEVPGEVIKTANNLNKSVQKEMQRAQATLGINPEEEKSEDKEPEKKEEKHSFFRF